MDELTLGQRKLILTIISNNKISDYGIKISVGSEKGENYLSTTKSITIEDKSSKKLINLFLKCAQKCTELRQQLPIEIFFQTEVSLYESTFPELLLFYQNRHAQYEFPKIARYYGKCLDKNEEWIVLENLKFDGFKLINKKASMDCEHAKLVLREYGKLHALSLALKDQKPEEFERIRARFLDKPINVPSQRKNRFFDSVIKILQNEKQIKAMTRFKESCYEFIDEMRKEKTVVTHGDCWSGNILFKYEDSVNPNIPTELCFVDYQVSKVTTPVADLSYFLLINTAKEVFGNISDCLAIYHESLSRMLKELGSDANKVFPYTELEHHWKKYSKFGFYMAVLFLKSMLTERESPDLVHFAKSSHYIDAFYVESKGSEIYETRMRDLVSFFVDNNFL